jgi:hypothetical protein
LFIQAIQPALTRTYILIACFIGIEVAALQAGNKAMFLAFGHFMTYALLGDIVRLAACLFSFLGFVMDLLPNILRGKFVFSDRHLARYYFRWVCFLSPPPFTINLPAFKSKRSDFCSVESFGAPLCLVLFYY